MSSDTIDLDDFPLIGEPLPIEFANSLYLAEGETIDFLATSSLMRTWFDLAIADTRFPEKIRRTEADAIRELRNGVHLVLRGLANGRNPTVEGLEILNRYAARSPQFLRVTWPDRAPAVTVGRTGNAVDGLLGRIATETIVLIAGPSRSQLRQCGGPGCAMLFVKNHHKRRWCHRSCGHRSRQASYYRRKTALISPVTKLA
ncbi:MAG: ABATE domain-containing protein [Ilumatobacteraceae bacterium]